ncbi:MAG: diadenylate cyclase [Christensenellales bacterium]
MNFWEHIKQAFAGFGWADVLEIVIIAAVVMFVFLYSARHNSLFYTYVLAAMGFVVFAVTFAELGSFNVILVVLLLVVYTFGTVLLFNAELKRDVFKRSWKSILHTFSISGEGFDLSEEEVNANIANIVKACQNMSKADVGALIVVVRESISDSVLESGTMINAVISGELLETIFFPKSPLHDGAVIIKGNKILAAGCYLPLSQEQTLAKELGTRHRAALGITELNPTVTAIVVSEETGIITAVYDRQIKRYLDGQNLTKALQYAYNMELPSSRDTFWGVDGHAE